MQEKPFVDYYDVFQASPSADFETLERLFRHLAKLLHPDVSDGGDIRKFTMLVEAYETLKDPTLRAAYDAEYEQQKQQTQKLVEDAECLDTDSAQRHKLLSLLYARRRQDMGRPGLGDTTLENLVGCTREVMEFHLWYFRENGWIQREETGSLSITAAGVDKIEATLEKKAATLERRITEENNRVEHGA